MSDIPNAVDAAIRPHIPAPYAIYAIEWEKMGADDVLRLLIDKPGGIEIDETGTLSELISPLLDKMTPDPFPKARYMLEVASPGAERPLYKLSDYLSAVENGEAVSVSLYQKLNGDKQFVGELLSADDEKIVLSVADKGRKKTVEIPLSAVAKAQTILLF
ncbi:MAG: ribosome maturation factor RimP [Streptococcaceae bacterium]|jgi:ribosome maturation factor RimP|nr:ribosome maturation factor RimP [Streptococcaceae bacterium]